ncbi:fungal zn(2)-Cys(6) binuclear cluster domain-containing protein [Purpureocillium lilacinum]|uniref:Fungal zn(2)-Cys(6) binuclear cluster domain-containing protein n=1 Tax=Purpureocillium lilacinum TaxID=33203 RepID=A0A179GCA5_PURLI|nr:fungal zn(2)-Cys(6) binuclear cluster domain-containing protein [Purpureocillium lilacinum]OAQ75033.1 fungal zn(2)-Cys(6) binuclear cluster domain-containing protein [Purpureocillium lilacinum]
MARILQGFGKIQLSPRASGSPNDHGDPIGDLAPAAATWIATYACHICDRNFSRAEHRDRHLATHSLLRPYRCNFCGHQFQRTDSLRRHVDKCSKNLRNATANGSDEVRSRVKSACDLCHSKKLKCDGKQPCRKCVAKRHDCTYQRSDRLRLLHSPDSMSPPIDSRESKHIETETILVNTSDAALDDTSFVASNLSSSAEAASALPEAMLQGWMGGIDLAADVQLMQEHGMGLPCPDAMNPDCMGDLKSTINFADPLAWMGTTFLPGLEDEYFALNGAMLASPDEQFHDEAGLEYLAELLQLDIPGSQFDEQTARWLRMPLVPRTYDLEVLNSLLNIFLRHVSETFTSFKGFAITSHTQPEQILAMAAVGSLFVNLKGSPRISRVLFTDSNRLLNNSVAGSVKHSRPAAMSLVQAFLAAELFGICGGHPRSRELSEAYHHSLIQSLYMHGLLSTDDVAGNDKVQQERLVADILLLESYRTSLFQLKPILTPAYLAHTSWGVTESPDSDTAQPFNYVQQQALHLMNPQTSKHDPILRKLIFVSTGSWLASGHWVGSSYEATNRDYDPAIIHASVDTLLQNSSPNKISARFFGHMIIVALHAPLSDISDAAYSATMQREPTPTMVDRIRSWCRSFDVQTALEHALQIMDVVAMIPAMDLTISGERLGYIETPHDALCIFNAGLVIWASRHARFRQTAEKSPGSRSQLGQAVLVLKKMRLLLARTLGQVLQKLIQVESLKRAGGSAASTS